jgi:hypothetical protein
MTGHAPEGTEDDSGQFEYFEEEVLSDYDTGLSTIMEGDEESCSREQGDPSGNGSISPESRIPRNISLTPSGQKSPLEFSSKLWAFVSPLIFSPLTEARKLKLPPFNAPLLDNRQNSSSGNKSPTVQGMPMVLTSLESGEELLVMDEYDDEFTFVTCDTASVTGVPLSQNSDDHCSPLGPAHVGEETEALEWSSYAPPSSGDTDQILDFEGTKWQLKHALERRTKKGKILSERMDYTRRKIRYELHRKMIKERLNSQLIPARGGEGKS